MLHAALTYRPRKVPAQSQAVRKIMKSSKIDNEDEIYLSIMPLSSNLYVATVGAGVGMVRSNSPLGKEPTTHEDCGPARITLANAFFRINMGL